MAKAITALWAAVVTRTEGPFSTPEMQAAVAEYGCAVLRELLHGVVVGQYQAYANAPDLVHHAYSVLVRSRTRLIADLLFPALHDQGVPHHLKGACSVDCDMTILRLIGLLQRCLWIV